MRCLLVLFVLLAIGCNNEVTYQENYPDGTLKLEQSFDVVNSDTILRNEKRFYPNGNPQLESQYNNGGQREGVWKMWGEKGNLQSFCEYKNGVAHGQSKVYLPDGALKYEGRYENGEKRGVWKFYSPTGEVLKSQKF